MVGDIETASTVVGTVVKYHSTSELEILRVKLLPHSQWCVQLEEGHQSGKITLMVCSGLPPAFLHRLCSSAAAGAALFVLMRGIH